MAIQIYPASFAPHPDSSSCHSYQDDVSGCNERPTSNEERFVPLLANCFYAELMPRFSLLLACMSLTQGSPCLAGPIGLICKLTKVLSTL